MSRVHRIYAGGSQSLAAACNTKPISHPVVGKGQAPDNVPLYTPARFAGRAPSRGSAMGNLCDTLAVFGCNVNPRTTGTTRGEAEIISTRPKLV
jgi:hypothetical protein